MHQQQSIVHDRYRADIDGLRAIAVLSVVAFHVYPNWVSGGFVGVDIFFVISGFLISSIIFGRLANENFSYKDFYARRIRRIFPALILVLVASWLFGWFFLMSDDYEQLGKHIAAGAGFISNFVLWNEAGYFDISADAKPLLHLWSLGIEEQFYILWPLILALVWNRSHKILILTIAIAIVSFALNIYTSHANPVAAFYLPYTRFWELMIGGILAYILLHKPDCLPRNNNYLPMLGLLLILSSVLLLDKSKVFPGWWALMPTMGTILVIAAGPNTWVNRNVFSTRILVWVGLISYPLYLWHWPILSLAYIMNAYETPSLTERSLIIAASILLAWMTYQLIEKPIRFKQWIKPTSLFATLSILLIMGFYTYHLDGIGHRKINADPRNVFLHYYISLHRKGLSKSYREECDFYDWRYAKTKNAISSDCLRVGAKKTYFLWGDSHAQALSYGLRHLLPPGVTLAQVATSGCRPSISNVEELLPVKVCNKSNAFAMEEIKKLKPDVVILAQISHHEQTDWDAIADFIHKNGGGQVILLGPVPEWQPSLPIVITQHYWNKDYKFVGDGLDKNSLITNAALDVKYKNSKKLIYISLTDELCQKIGCRATVPGVPQQNLLVLDYGHLTLPGSEYVVKNIMQKHYPLLLQA